MVELRELCSIMIDLGGFWPFLVRFLGFFVFGFSNFG